MISVDYSVLYCTDYTKIQNYEEAVNDSENLWVIHHKLGLFIPREKLKELGLYFNRPPIELVYLTKEEHSFLHSKRNPMCQKGSIPWNKGKKGFQVAWNKGIPTEQQPRFGTHLSEETKKKISEANKGKCYLTDEQYRKIGEKRRGVLNTKNSKPVLQYTLTGELVKEWVSAAEAGRFGFSFKNISQCCKGEKKTHKGFIWKFKIEKDVA